MRKFLFLSMAALLLTVASCNKPVKVTHGDFSFEVPATMEIVRQNDSDSRLLCLIRDKENPAAQMVIEVVDDYLNLEGIEEGADNATIAEHLAANVQALADAFIFYEGNDVKLDEPFKIERNASEFTAQATAPYKGTANGDFVKGTVIADLFGTTAVNTLIDAPSEEMFNKLFLVYFTYVWDPKN